MGDTMKRYICLIAVLFIVAGAGVTANAQDAENITLVGRIADGPCTAVTAVHDSIYYTSGSLVICADITNPEAPSEMKTFELAYTINMFVVKEFTGSPWHGAIIGYFVMGNTIEVINLTGFVDEIWTYIDTYEAPGDITGIAFEGDYLYVTTDNSFPSVKFT